MKKFVYVLFMAFLFVSCGETHHQVTGNVSYRFEGDSIVSSVIFKQDFYLNGMVKNANFVPVLERSKDSSKVDLYIIGTYRGNKLCYGPYNLVNAPGKRIVYSDLNYKYTVKIN